MSCPPHYLVDIKGIVAVIGLMACGRLNYFKRMPPKWFSLFELKNPFHNYSQYFNRGGPKGTICCCYKLYLRDFQLFI